MRVKLLHLRNFDILSQLEIEEALLKSASRSFCIINEGSPKYIIMGISNKPSELLDLDKIKRDNIKIIKRFSGGGTVFVDEETIFITFIFSKKHLSFYFPEEIYSWTDNLYKNIFGTKDFLRIENDYVLKDKKCCGNAQYIKKERWLHHSSFLWNYNFENMKYLKIPPKAPNYRKNRDHQDFLCSISSYFDSKESFTQKIKNELSKHFKLDEMSLEEIKPLFERKYNRSTTLL